MNKRLKKWLILFIRVLVTVPTLVILYYLLGLNSRLYYSLEYKNNINVDVYKQLQHLKVQRENGASEKMQQYFPEGLMFFECLYGISWAELIVNVDTTSPVYKMGIKEINNCITAVNSNNAKNQFDSNNQMKYGAFYTGWSNYLIGKKIELSSNRASDITLFKNNCEKIAKALSQSESPFLESYPNNCWPADVTIAVASLALHDKIFDIKYDSIIKNWIDKVKTRLDINGLIPHSVTANTGASIEDAKGSSQSLMLTLLPEIDSAFARQQFERFKELFIESKFGLNAVREYPKGIEGEEHIDSGPILLDIGVVSTIVAQKASLNNQDFELAIQLNNGIEAFGLPSTSNNSKYYLWGYMEIGDVFIAWTRASDKNKQLKSESWWQLSFHMWSLVLFIPCVILLIFIWKPEIKRIRSKVRINR